MSWYGISVLGLRLFHRSHAELGTNYVVGPSYGVAMVLLIALRIGPEERMMIETFGPEYERYMARTKRLVPGLW